MDSTTSSRVTPLRDGTEPQLPANIPIEQNLIGAILINNAAYGRVSEFLLPEHFFEPVHRRLFEAIGKLIERGAPVDPVSLKNLFDQDASLVDIGGAQYLMRLAKSAVSITNVPFYGRTIHDLYLRRQLIAIGQDVVTEAFRQDLDDLAPAQIERATQKLFELGETGIQRRAMTIGEASQKSLDLTQQAYRDPAATGVRTGIASLDRIIGGFLPGDFDIIGGRPGQGKSAAMNSITWAALLAGKPVHIFSGEMTAEQLAARLMAALSGVSAGRQRRGDLELGDWDALMAAQAQMKDWPLLIDDGPLTLARVRQAMRQEKRRLNTALVIIDYLQLMRIEGEESRYAEVGRISTGLKTAAKDLGLPIIALSQLSRRVEERDDHRPIISDLRDSGSLEQDADVIVMLYRAEVYLAKTEPQHKPNESDIDFQKRHSIWANALEGSRGKGELICGKVRHDQPGVAHVRFDGARSFFYDERLADDERLF